jgi:hypothetical protein
MERFACLKNILLKRRIVVHLGGGNQVLDIVGLAWIRVWRLGLRQCSCRGSGSSVVRGL